jgi:CheY-like chemotaxis protein
MNSPDQIKPAILIAEDDPDDRLLLEVAFSALKDACYIFFVNDGEELMEYLHRRGAYAKSMPPRPGLILLDLNMPKKDGRQALVEIKGEADLKDIPLIVWTTSSVDEDIWLCGEAGADGYVTKPCSFLEMDAALRDIVKNWLQLPV